MICTYPRGMGDAGEVAERDTMFGLGREPESSAAEIAAGIAHERGYGGHSMVAPLRRVLVQAPCPPLHADDGERFGYPRPVDHDRAVREHDVFCALLRDAGVEVIAQPASDAGLLDAIFVYDPSLVTDEGVILASPGKDVRVAEVDLAAGVYESLGIPVIGRIDPPGTVDGGDIFWIDRNTVAVGEGYRTNRAGIDQLRIYLHVVDVDIVTVPLPHWHGPGECLHLLSLISPIVDRQAVAYLSLLPVPFIDVLRSLGWSFVEIPDEEFASQGCNVLALAPRQLVVLHGNPVTKGRLEDAGCDVQTYVGDEISHNRAGGPTCLTRPILRDMRACFTSGETARS